jgi:hypothetical protein
MRLFKVLESHGYPTSLEKLTNVPLLSACVKEGIRWAGAASAMMPRFTPVGGVELAGQLIPEGVSFTSPVAARLQLNGS